MTELRRITPEQVISKLDEVQPDWWKEWADQRDLLDLINNYLTEDGLKSRVINKVWPLGRAIYLITLEHDHD